MIALTGFPTAVSAALNILLNASTRASLPPIMASFIFVGSSENQLNTVSIPLRNLSLIPFHRLPITSETLFFNSVALLKMFFTQPTTLFHVSPTPLLKKFFTPFHMFWMKLPNVVFRLPTLPNKLTTQLTSLSQVLEIPSVKKVLVLSHSPFIEPEKPVHKPSTPSKIRLKNSI